MGKLAAHLPGCTVRVVTFDHTGARELDGDGGLDVRRTKRAAGRRRIRIASLSANATAEALRFRPDAVLVGHVAAFPAGAMIRRVARVPEVLYVHADEFRVWPRRCRLAVRSADAVIAVSRHSEAMAQAAGAPADHVHRIPCGVDLSDWASDRAADGNGRPTVLTIARMVERHKGHDMMLRAMPLVLARVPAARWVVVGDGPLRTGYERDAAAAGLDQSVTFTGSVHDAERDSWLGRAHVFAMPSRLPPGGVGGEGFGIVYLEAAAHRLPVVAANEGGALDAVDPTSSAVLVDPRDHVALADALVGLLSDPARARKLGDAGYAWAANFSWPATASRVAAVLRSVSADRRAG
jgi:phosphatidylinositol alpha-1,6-mannosyltransferase